MIGITIDYRYLQKSMIIAFCLFFLAHPLLAQATLSAEQQALFDELLARAEEELPEDAIPEGIRNVEEFENFLTEQAVENLEDFVPEELNIFLDEVGSIDDFGGIEDLDDFLTGLGDIEGVGTIEELRDFANVQELNGILNNIAENTINFDDLENETREILSDLGINNFDDFTTVRDVLRGVENVDDLRALGDLGAFNALGPALERFEEFRSFQNIRSVEDVLSRLAEGIPGVETLEDLGALGENLRNAGVETLEELSAFRDQISGVLNTGDLGAIGEDLGRFFEDVKALQSLEDLGSFGELISSGAVGEIGETIESLLEGNIAEGLVGGGLGFLFGGGGECDGPCFACGICQPLITNTHEGIRENTEREWNAYRRWFVEEFFFAAQIPDAMMLMAEQLTAVGIQQIQIIGTFFDAKHQLETQRLFQTLTAEAHKDYHPSEELCEIGTNTKSLAASERISNLGQLTFANRMMQRQLLSRDVLSGKGEISDRESRIKQFREVFCNPNDNGAHLQGEDSLCGNGGIQERYNLDVDYTSALESKLTLDLGFGRKAAASADEGNIYALGANLFGHQTLNVVADRVLATTNHRPKELAYFYLRQRAVAAKRSVAQNSYAALTSMRASGNNESAPFLKAVIRELGVAEEHINPYIGESPSYFAQMEVLTKKLYQNPKFYAELYDKPANVERRGAALQAIALMQDRDIYKSLLRSEAVLATLLETLIRKEHDRISRDLATLRQEGEALPP